MTSWYFLALIVVSDFVNELLSMLLYISHPSVLQQRIALVLLSQQEI